MRAVDLKAGANLQITISNKLVTYQKLEKLEKWAISVLAPAPGQNAP